MPLALSGPISIGGSNNGNSVNLQLSRAIGASTTMNESVTRILAATSTTPNMPYSFSNFYGKGIVGGGVVQGVNSRWSVTSTSGSSTSLISAHATMNLFSDGQGNIVVAGAGTVGSPGWYTTVLAGVGNSYWVRATLTDSGDSLSGVATAADSFLGTFGTWEQLNTTRTWRVQRTLTRTAAGTATATLFRTFTLEFAASAGGTPLIATHPLITLRASPQLNVETSNTPNNGYAVYYQRFGVAISTVTFTTNGVVTATGQGTQTIDNTPDWYTPTTTSIGNSYWIRFVETSASGGGATVSGDALNTWHQLNVGRSRTVSTGSTAEANYVYSYQISTSASGTPVVASGTIDLNALNTQF
jgi:hypothetical protein